MNNSRALIITFFMLGFLGLLISKLFEIQVTDYEKYKYLAERQQIKWVDTKAERGIIKDYNGEVLAFTKDDVSFFVDIRMLTERSKKNVAKKFAEVFNKNEKYYLELMENGIKNICLEKKAPMEKSILLNDFIVDGLFKEEDHTREYTYSSLASHVIGYVDRNIKGVAGIENYYDDRLTGTDGSIFIERDVYGRMISIDDRYSEPSIPGNNVYLTLRKTYQKILEDELIKGLHKYNGKSAVGIIMNPYSGEIFALSNLPNYDPLNYNLFPADALRNRALTDPYEPGSTIKSIIMAILIENKLVREDEVIDTENGSYRFQRVNIRDSHGFKNLTVREILEHSSNIGMAKLSRRLNAETLYKFLRDFGLGNPTSIDLPSETEGTLKKPKQFSVYSKPFISFGYELSATPLQLITAFSALINGGILFQPYTVSKITNYKNEIIEEFKPKSIRRVISKETSDLIKDFMIGVVERGTGKSARMDEILIGGKTGTSQKLINNQYSSAEYNSSFIGFLPAEKPKIVCLILVNSPSIGKYGSKVAAPIFRAIAERLIETDLDIAPDKNRVKRKHEAVKELIADISSENDNPALFFTNDLNEITDSDKKNQVSSTMSNKMPDLSKLSIRDAVAQLTEIGIQYKIIGNGGRIYSQSVKPGTKILPGSVCIIKCESINKTNVLHLN